MLPITVSNEPNHGDFEPLEAIPFGQYQCRFVKAEEKPGYNVGDDSQLLWTFRVMDERYPQFLEHPLWIYTGKGFHIYKNKLGQLEKTKARKLAEALLRRELRDLEVLDWSDFDGKIALLGVNCEWNQAKGENRNKVINFLPVSGETVTHPPRGQQAQTNPQAMYAPAGPVATSVEDEDYKKRYTNNIKLLKYGLPQIKEVIEMIAGSRQPFFELPTDSKRMVVEYLDMLLQEGDIPFDDDEKPMEQPVVVGSEPVRSVGQRQIPASAGLKVS